MNCEYEEVESEATHFSASSEVMPRVTREFVVPLNYYPMRITEAFVIAATLSGKSRRVELWTFMIGTEITEGRPLSEGQRLIIEPPKFAQISTHVRITAHNPTDRILNVRAGITGLITKMVKK